MQSINVMVVDDEPLARDELTFLLDQCDGASVVGEADSAQNALEKADDLDLDLMFVDLRMPGPDGIALAESIQRRRPDTLVVVISAHDDGAIRAFEAQVFDYLLKPVRLERLQQTIARATERILAARQSDNANKEPDPNKSLDRIAVRRRGAYVVLEVNDIMYFEVKDELVWAITRHNRYALDLTLTAVEQRVPKESFFRSHRAYLVRIDGIRAIEPVGGGLYTLRIDHPDDPPIPLARERARQLRGRIPFAG